jgi:predicted amidohydrolase
MPTRVTETFTVAAVGFNPEIFELDRNIAAAGVMLQEAASNGAKIIVLPELCLSGCNYPSLEAWLPYMDTVPGKATEAFSAIAKANGCYITFGVAEVEPATGMTFNAAALVGPDGYIGKYRKTGTNMADVTAFRGGNAGYPVFPTEYGNIAMFICYDDTFWEPARVAALKGADIICHSVASARAITNGPMEAAANAVNHSTIAAAQEWCAWNGVALISANSNNAESNPTTGMTYWEGGAQAIWSPDGTLLARSAATTPDVSIINEGTITYATIDPALFDNAQRRSFADRRPELYNNLSFFRVPIDLNMNLTPHEVSAHSFQYAQSPGDARANITTTDNLVLQLEATKPANALVVLPAFSFTGIPRSADEAHAWAEAEMGLTTQALSGYATRLGAHVVGSHIERDGDQLFHSVVLLGSNGKLIGRYRQTHLDESMKSWATPGDEIPVFATEIGTVGLLTCGDVRFPEAAGTLEVSRADIIAIPSQWDGSYGALVNEPEDLFTNPYPKNSMIYWYAIAKCMQAFTVVANPVGGNYRGSSGIFTVSPVMGDSATVGSTDGNEIVSAEFTTLGSKFSWMNQQILITQRRADLAVPLTLATDSPAFIQWRDAPGFDISAWSAYSQ